ncbi:hypothetical protein LJC33_01850 [Eubacteriales bacterium OttesenSCG-928-N13]|nr:hypothetical protein [Eubacteriales bacterium OttesenSCG-928-N13]
MMINMSSAENERPALSLLGVANYISGSVSFSGEPSGQGVWCPCPGQQPVMILGYYRTQTGAEYIFAQDLYNTPYQQQNLTTIDKETKNKFIRISEYGSAGVQTGLARGTTGTCFYRILYANDIWEG